MHTCLTIFGPDKSLPVMSLLVEKLRDHLGWYCADLSTSMKFGTHVDQTILNSFLRAPKPEVIGVATIAKSNMAASRYYNGHNFVTKSRRIMRDGSFYMFLTSTIPNLNSVLA